MISDYFKLAFNNLRKRGLRSWLTILGIFIGIAAVVSLISLGAGLKAAVLGQFGSLAFDVLTVQNEGTGFGPPGSTVVDKLNEHDLEIIEDVRGVKRVIPRLLRVVSLEYNRVAGFGYVIDMPDDNDDLDFIYEKFGLEIAEGSLFHEGDSGRILLGSDFAETDDFEKDFEVGKKVLINGKEFVVGGILEKSNSAQMNMLVYMMNNDLEDLLEINNEYDLIAVQVEDKDDIEEVAGIIEEELRDDRDEDLGKESFSVDTPLQSLESVNTILNIINLIVVGIAAISLFVGATGIANTMYTSVIERTKEIGVMKSIGAQNKDVLWIFLIESGLLGLVGGIVGAIIGLLAAIGVSNIANSALGSDIFTISINYTLLFGAVGFSFVVGIISGVLPALQASKLNVVDALRS